MSTLARVVVGLVFLAVLRPLPAAAGQRGGSHPALPPNIQVGEFLQAAAVELLRTSATFRRQCERIGAARLVRVVVVSQPRPALQGGVRAQARISRHALGLLFAVIELPMTADYRELLPHELEHVIEQIEGRDLAAMARTRDSGVTEISRGMFETARARAAGRAAAREALGHKHF